MPTERYVLRLLPLPITVVVFALAAHAPAVAASPPVAPAVLEAVSVAAGGALAANGARDASISDDGRYVVFVSMASNLVEGDTNGLEDVFVRDRVAGTTARVSVASDGTQANGGSFVATISGDGHIVAFVSEATNLVAADTNGMRDVFVRDLVSRQTSRVNLAADGSQSEIDPLRVGGTFPSLSRDGRLVAFSSAASDLVPSDTNGWFDVFVKDRQTGIITRESVADDRTQGDGPSMNAVISADGRCVAFDSWAANLVTGDANHLGDVFVRDRALATTTLVNVSTGGAQSNGVSGAPRISADGRIVVFWSTATNLVAGDRDPVGDIFIRDRATNRTARLNAAANPFGAGTYALAANGRFIAYSTFVEGASIACDDVFVYDRGTNLATRVSIREEDGQPGSCSREPALSADGRVVAFEGGQFLRHDAVAQQVFALDLDSDDDTMPDAWESAFGLDPLDTADAAADADGDGRANVDECVAASHPRATVVRYFAEGASSSLFDARFALLNPGEVTLHALLTFQHTSGDTRRQAVTIAPHSRAAVSAHSVVDLDGWEFSTLVESDGEFVADRLMRWDATGYGSHLETAIAEPSVTWYFAEGATHSEFQLFYLLQNPDSTRTAQVEVTFLRPKDAFPLGASRLVRTYAIAPHSRLNVWVNLVDPLLARTDVSASIRVTNDVPILAERAMYQDVPRWDPVTGAALGLQFLGAGTVAAGVTAPATTWYLAEGATGWLDEFVLIANPGDVDASIDAQFLLPDGTVVTRTYTVAAASRFTIWVNAVEVGGARPLSATAHATVVTSTNGVPVIAERAMWWPSTRNGWWEEGHSVVGSTQAGRVWAFADGEVAAGVETYILIASLGVVQGTARVTLVFDDGTTSVKEFALPAHSRVNVQVAHDFPDAVGRPFGAVVESLLPDGVPILVERSMYSDAGGVHWAAGAAAMATLLRP